MNLIEHNEWGETLRVAAENSAQIQAVDENVHSYQSPIDSCASLTGGLRRRPPSHRREVAKWSVNFTERPESDLATESEITERVRSGKCSRQDREGTA